MELSKGTIQNDGLASAGDRRGSGRWWTRRASIGSSESVDEDTTKQPVTAAEAKKQMTEA